jgi:beta-carotene 3-hydroxylase
MAIATAAFVAMEPFTAAVHRLVMHGVGAVLHRSHHRRRVPGDRRWETNDWYPVIFAALVNIGFFAGFNWDGFGALVPVGVGITAYGAAYALVHDGYIHGRLPWFAGRRYRLLDRLADAHRLHHRYNTAPYGMLLPVVPRALRHRHERVPVDAAAAAR